MESICSNRHLASIKLCRANAANATIRTAAIACAEESNPQLPTRLRRSKRRLRRNRERSKQPRPLQLSHGRIIWLPCHSFCDTHHKMGVLSRLRRPQRYSHSWSQREQDDASQVLGSLSQRQGCTCSDSGEVAMAAKTSRGLPEYRVRGGLPIFRAGRVEGGCRVDAIAVSYDTAVSEVGRLVLVWAHKAAALAVHESAFGAKRTSQQRFLMSVFATKRTSVARQGPQSSSAARFTAGAFGFLTVTQCGERPER